MSLYNKYRPAKLEELSGNKEIIKSVQNIFEKGDIPHAWLLSGEAGTGKTTLARIISTMLKSEDVNEYNIGDLRGIDNIRELSDKCAYKPFLGETSVYIMDEVAGLTKDSQVCLLKLLEDPPSHAYFILCTTDPDKLSTAIRSRCIKLQTMPLSMDDMENLLESVSKKEGMELSVTKKMMIVRMANGSSRTALSMLEAVRDLSDEESIKLLSNMIVVSEDSQVNEFVKILAGDKPSWSEVSALLRGFDGKNVESIRIAVVNYAAAVLKNRDSFKHYLILDAFKSQFYDGMSALVRCTYEIVKGGAK